MKLVFDIDGVICSNTWGKYDKAKPYNEIIYMINKLYDKGHIIIFHSARGFEVCDGILEDINNKWYDFTEKQLKSWGLKYHLLILGKPNGDLYFDDRARNVCGEHPETLKQSIRDIK